MRRLRMPERLRERGAVAVEFALVFPILIIMVFGIIDFGYLVNRVSIVNNAARDAAREGSLNATQAQVTSAATTRLTNIPGATVTVTCKKPDNSACSNYDADVASGGTSVVKVVYVHQLVTPIAALFGHTVTIDRTVQMRVE